MNDDFLGNNKYFHQVLSTMVTNAAYADAVRHLYDNGLSIDEIKNELDYPVSTEKIEAVISDYEKKKQSHDNDYEYIQHQDEYGRRSFIKVKK